MLISYIQSIMMIILEVICCNCLLYTSDAADE